MVIVGETKGVNVSYTNKVCYICNKVFSPNSGSQSLCSVACSTEARRKRDRKRRGYSDESSVGQSTECVICGNTFSKVNHNQLCCSGKCTKENSLRRAREYQRQAYTSPSDLIGIRPDIPWNMTFDPWDTYEPQPVNDQYGWADILPVI